MATATAVLEVKRILKYEGNGSVRAFCDVAVGDAVLIRGVKVVEGSKGLFVSMPREQGRNGQWYDTVSPVTKDIRKHLSELVLEAYSSATVPEGKR